MIFNLHTVFMNLPDDALQGAFTGSYSSTFRPP